MLSSVLFKLQRAATRKFATSENLFIRKIASYSSQIFTKLWVMGPHTCNPTAAVGLHVCGLHCF